MLEAVQAILQATREMELEASFEDPLKRAEQRLEMVFRCCIDVARICGAAAKLSSAVSRTQLRRYTLSRTALELSAELVFCATVSKLTCQDTLRSRLQSMRDPSMQ